MYGSPFISYPSEVEYVQKQSFLAGWLGNRRPLLGVETSNIIYNMQRNAIGRALIIGFSQVAQS